MDNALKVSFSVKAVSQTRLRPLAQPRSQLRLLDDGQHGLLAALKKRLRLTWALGVCVACGALVDRVEKSPCGLWLLCWTADCTPGQSM